MEGISPDLFKGLLDSGKTNPAVLARKFIEVGGNKELVEKMMENLDPVLFGPDLVQISCKSGNFEALKMLLEKGCDINNVPETIQADENYRKTPFLIEAAASGSMPTVNMVLDAGASPLDCGFITFSKKKRNLVVSNAIGAAAFNGRHQVMESFIRKLDSDCLELQAIETPDNRNTKKSAAFVAEMAKYTPLMLAVAGDDKNLECVKTLLKNKANYKVVDQYENNLLHIAAMNGNNKIIEYLGKNLDIEIFARNSKGETALNICSAAKNEKGIEILKQFQSDYDQSKSVADQLFEELNAETRKAEEDKAKKSAKRHRNKVNKIAKAEGKTIEQVEQELKEKEEQKKREEELAAKREAEAEARKELEAKQEAERKRKELRQLQEELARAEAIERQELARQRAEEQRARQARAREEEMERQRIRQERDAARRKTRAADQDAAPEKKERMRSARRAPAAEPAEEPEEQKASETARTPRHTEKADARQRANSRAIQRNNSKSVRREGEEGGVTLGGENQFNAGSDGTIFGLTGEIAAKAVGRRAKKSIAQQKKEEEEEEQRTKQRMLELKAERERKKQEDADAAKKAVEEEKKQKKREAEKARKERQKAAKAEKEKAAEATSTLAAPEADKKEQDAVSKKSGEKKERTKSARKNKKAEETPAPEAAAAVDESTTASDAKKKKGAAKAKEDKPKKEYRAKNAAPAEGAAEEKPKVEAKEAQAPKEAAAAPTPEAKPADKPAAEKTEKAEKPKQPKKKADKKKDAEKSVAASDADQKENQQPATNVQAEAPKQAAKKEQKKAAPKSVSVASTDEVDKLRQLVLQKETEIHRLEVHLEKKEAKITEKGNEITQLKDQLASSAKGDELKQQVSTLTASLNKQMALNRLQAAQVIELEESLWQANKAKDEALASTAPDGPGAEDAALEKARNDVRVKHVQVRDLQAKVDGYQGKAAALNFMSKGQLSELQDQLQATLANIALAMEHVDAKAK